MITITVACPEAMIGDANQLARVLGYGPDDDQTYGAALWQDADGNRYAVSSGLVSEVFQLAAVSPLRPPPWGADMEAANRVQALILISNGESAQKGKLVAVFNEDPQVALQILGLTRILEVE